MAVAPAGEIQLPTTPKTCRKSAGASASNGSSYPPTNRQELPNDFLLPHVLQKVCSGTKIEIMTSKTV